MSEWKETEIGIIPSRWEVGDLQTDVVVKGRIGWKGYKTSDLVEKGPYVIGGTEIKNDIFLDLSNAKCLSREKFQESPEIILKDGDLILVTRGNGLADIGYFDGKHGEATINPSVIILQPKKIDSKFLFYYFISKLGRSQVLSLESGSSIPAIYQADVRKLKYPKPTNYEIEYIVKTMYSIDSKISLLRQQNQTLEELAQTLFKRWFVDFEFPNEKGEPYKSSGGKMIDSELGEIPEEWELKPLDDLVTVHNGYSYKGSELQESDVAMVTLKNFDRNGGFRFDGFKEIVSSNYKEKHIVQVGDLVVAHTDLTHDAEVLGNPAIIMKNDKYKELIISMDLVKVESKDPFINSEFLYFLMAEKRFKSHCKGYSNGTTVLHLSKNAIPEYLFPLPDSSDLIVLFGNYAKTVYSKIVKNISEIQNVTNLRDTLLPKLMSGEIEIN